MKLSIAALVALAALSTSTNAEADNPCNVCPDGLPTPDYEISLASLGASGNVTTCQQLVDDAKEYEADGEVCETMKPYEFVCCPWDAEFPENKPCVICPGGATAGDDHVPWGFFDESTSCGEIINEAKMYVEGSYDCTSTALSYEDDCCPAPPENPCKICVDGITAGANHTPWEIIGDTSTCEDLVEEALKHEQEEYMCEEAKNVEKHCCPVPPEDPCVICPGGITAEEGFVPHDWDPRTCEELVSDALNYEEGGTDCTFYKVDELFCCLTSNLTYPEADDPAPPENPCVICPGGITEEEGFVPYKSDPRTCEELVSDALKHEEDGLSCTLAKVDEGFCCYTPPEADDPCTICPDGITVKEDDTPESDYMNCKDIVETTKIFEADSFLCELNKNTELFCCPTPPENPCTLCPDGITHEEDDDPESAFMNCQYSLQYAKTFEASSIECDSSKDTELFCCPTPPENPCALCPDGITVEEDDDPGSAFMNCKDAVETLKLYEADSSICEDSKNNELYCCPTPLDNPCSLCPDGVTVEEDDDPDSDYMMCKSTVENAKFYEADNPICEDIKFNEMVCCPTPQENPCPICPNGLAVGEDFQPWVDGDEENDATCGEIMFQASLFSADSEVCTSFLEEIDADEFLCCPGSPVGGSPSTAAATTVVPPESTDDGTSTTMAANQAPESTEATTTAVSTVATAEGATTVAAEEVANGTITTDATESTDATTSTTDATTPAPESTSAAPGETQKSTTTSSTASATQSTQIPDGSTEPDAAGSVSALGAAVLVSVGSAVYTFTLM